MPTILTLIIASGNSSIDFFLFKGIAPKKSGNLFILIRSLNLFLLQIRHESDILFTLSYKERAPSFEVGHSSLFINDLSESDFFISFKTKSYFSNKKPITLVLCAKLTIW